MDRARIEDFLRHSVAAEIPHDPAAIGASVSLGVPVVISGHSTPATAAFERLAAAVMGNAGPADAAEHEPGKKRGRRRLGFASRA